ncbi:toxin BrnT [Candidatus Termititenax aidoneus]|uniref:Toxin BrnT n=1 Tax=Termititenax aidoneus TaxID=2218524 RepID=A0A388TBE5_TERA1|nr:toxin BrnT [Candidatus Termititenax aidoneus]
MRYVWDEQKNTLLKQTRDISFAEIMLAIEDQKVVAVFDHPNQAKYKGQIFILVEVTNYVYVVPAEIRADKCLLKTIYPSRKYTKQYLGKD